MGLLSLINGLVKALEVHPRPSWTNRPSLGLCLGIHYGGCIPFWHIPSCQEYDQICHRPCLFLRKFNIILRTWGELRRWNLSITFSNTSLQIISFGPRPLWIKNMSRNSLFAAMTMVEILVVRVLATLWAINPVIASSDSMHVANTIPTVYNM